MYIQRIIVESLAASNIIKKVTSVGDDERPVVFWHGYGDSYNSTAMQHVIGIVRETKPDSYTYSIKLDDDGSKDQRLSMFSDVNMDIDYVCKQLREVDSLANGFDMIGFSQGGLFARAAVERCALPVHTLITFGSPHSGISDLPKCAPNDWLCKKKNDALTKPGNIWRDWVQNTVVPAQYFRRRDDYYEYLEKSAFLADVNNERENKQQLYKDNLGSLERLVLIQFEQDQTVVPKCTAWFCDEDDEGNYVSFVDTKFYRKDLLGLKSLYDNGQIDFLSVDDDHMSFSDDYLREIAQRYLGKHSTA